MSKNSIKYSISDLAKLSGIKPHTLRIWEQRYGILKPKRTDTKIRFYTDEDVKHVMNISLLNRNGIKISKIAELCSSEISGRVCEIENVCCTHQMTMDQLIKCMVTFDELLFEKILNAAIIQHGFKTVMLDIVYPFLEKIGILWVTGSVTPAQEHFICNLIRQKLIVAIDGQVTNVTNRSKRILMFLPQYEMHELSLLFFAFLFKTRNHQIIYLGANLPFKDVQSVIDAYKPNYVFTVLTACMHIKQTVEVLNKVSEANKNITFAIGGVQAFHLAKSKQKNIHCFSSLKEILHFQP